MIVGKGENAYLIPAFSPFPVMFTKAFIIKVVKTLDFVVKVLIRFCFILFQLPKKEILEQASEL